MKALIFLILISIASFSAELTLKEGSVLGTTEVMGDRDIDPLNTSLNTSLRMNGDDILSIKGSISVEMELFKSSNSDRDANMYETLEIDKFTTATYEIKNITQKKNSQKYNINGVLELHGVKKDLDFEADIIAHDDVINIKALSSIDVTDFGIKMPCLLGFAMCVDDNVRLDAKAILTK